VVAVAAVVLRPVACGSSSKHTEELLLLLLLLLQGLGLQPKKGQSKGICRHADVTA
jgi:hypothetical protein